MVCAISENLCRPYRLPIVERSIKQTYEIPTYLSRVRSPAGGTKINIMKTKLQINDRVETPDGLHGIIVEVEPIGEFKIILDSGETAYWFPEDLRKEDK